MEVVQSLWPIQQDEDDDWEISIPWTFVSGETYPTCVLSLAVDMLHLAEETCSDESEDGSVKTGKIPLKKMR